ncbi:hypothetical protein AGMMS49983_20570 [Clostridia bacterium]|nr:hypothetical protein AGMMS49983_20570 [Clostridia bacterium]
MSEVHTLLFERIVPWVKKGGATILWKITTPGNKRLPDSFFEWAFNDFWLLMSLTPNEEGDDLTIIMENWETLNRAFSFDELNSAMSKLIQNGYAERCGIGRFRQAEKALKFFNENHIVEEITVEKLKRLEKKFIALPILKEVHYVEYFSKGEFHLAETGGKK